MSSKDKLDRQLIQLCDRGEIGKAQRLAAQHGKPVSYITRVINQQTKELDRLNRAIKKAEKIRVAASGKTKTGDRAKVSAHQRKATQKQVRSKVASGLLKDTQTGQCPYCTGTYTVRSGVWKCSNDGCQSNFAED